jgi:F-type H+-transporting ATPase subunit b
LGAGGSELYSKKSVDLLHQLSGLFLAAVPTAVIVFLFYLFLRWSFFGPITRVMAERKARTAGARKDAERLRAEAQEKQRTRQEALRKARGEILAEQEAARRVALDQRSAAIQQARGRANEEIQGAKTRISAEIEAARAELEATGNELAEEIVRAILDRQQLNPSPAGKA